MLGHISADHTESSIRVLSLATEQRRFDGLLNPKEPWQRMRSSMSVPEMVKTLALLREIDPDRYLPKSRAPMLVQCARFDSRDNVRACPEVYRLAGGAKGTAVVRRRPRLYITGSTTGSTSVAGSEAKPATAPAGKQIITGNSAA